MPTTDELDARVRVLEERAGIAPPSSGPAPAGLPAKPGRPDAAVAKDSTVLTWPDPGGVDEWDVLDLANVAEPLKQTVREPRYVGSPYKAGKPPRRYAVRARNAAGESELSDPVDVPPAASGGDTTAPSAPATGGVDLSRWKLTIPETSDGKVVEIRPPALATYSDKYFWRNPADGSLRFRVWHGGATTSGSSNPRSELRERVGDDPEGYWPAGKGRHVMEWSGQVNRLTKVKPHCVIGQVHDQDDDVVVWRVEGDKLWLTNGDNPHGFLVDAAFTLGKPYTCRYEIMNGDYSFSYNGVRLDYPLRSTAPSYFKVGAYAQTNPKSAPGESTDEYDEVVVHAVSVSHTA